MNLPVAIDCSSAQCRDCPLYRSRCAGYNSCCGASFAEGQFSCQRECLTCLGMKDDDGYAHNGAPNVCGKPEALLREELKQPLPLPAYQAELPRTLPHYIPVFSRFPRGELRKMPAVSMAAIPAGETRRYWSNPENWTRFARRSILFCSEQDSRQDEAEGWYGSFARDARERKLIYAATGIEFSCYDTDGNAAHYRSLRRAWLSCNSARAEFQPVYPALRLLVDDLMKEWLAAVPGLFIPYFPLDAAMFNRLDRWVRSAGGWSRVRVLVAHTRLSELQRFPQHVRRAMTFLDHSALSSTLAGHDRGHGKDLTRVELIERLFERRSEEARKVLRG